jgi:hypothetical protein
LTRENRDTISKTETNTEEKKQPTAANTKTIKDRGENQGQKHLNAKTE